MVLALKALESVRIASKKQQGSCIDAAYADGEAKMFR